MAVEIKIIGCPKWGALPSKEPITWTPGPAKRIIFHHTAGHHAEIDTPGSESVLEAIIYARNIQHFHMAPPPQGRGWNDSGHNFLVCRNGVILQGRWRTIRAIQAGRMVVSAHCPGQNTNIGIEHEHLGDEPITKKQAEASALLQAWIAEQYQRQSVLLVDPHSAHFSTTCPANLAASIAGIRERAQEILAASRRSI